MKKQFLLLCAVWLLSCPTESGAIFESIIGFIKKSLVKKDYRYTVKNGIFQMGDCFRIDLSVFAGGRPVQLIKKVDPVFGKILEVHYAGQLEKQRYGDPILGTIYLFKC